MNINVRYLSNMAWLFSDIMLKMVSSLLVGILIARYMGVEKFGLYNYLLAVFSIFLSLSTLGMNGVVVKELVVSSAHEEVLGSALFLQRVGACVASLILVIWALFIYGNKPADFLIAFFVMLPTILIQSSNIYKYWFEYIVLSKYTVISQNISLLIGVVLKLLVVFLKLSYLYIIFISVIEQFCLMLSLILFFKARNPKFTFQKSKQMCAHLFSKSWPLVLSGLSFVLYVRLDQIMVGELLGIEHVGIFSAAVKLVEVWYFFPGIVVGTFFPALIKLRLEDRAEYNRKIQLLYDLVSLVGVGIVLGTFLFAEFVIKHTFGVQYIEAAFQLKLYSLICVFYFFNSVSGRWYINEGLQKVALFRNILGLIIAVILNFVLIPSMGLTGATVSTIVAYISSAYLFDLIDKRTRIVFFQKTKSLFLIGAIRRLKLEYFK